MSDASAFHSPSTDRVVITGMGVVSPLGTDLPTTWERMIAGTSGLRWLPEGTDFFPDPRGRPACRAGGPIELLPDGTVHDRLDLTTRSAIVASREAIQNAADVDGVSGKRSIEPGRFGCVIGTSKGGVRALQSWRTDSVDDARFEAVFHESRTDAACLGVVREFGLRGPSIAPVAACATGLLCLGRGAELVRRGECDAVLAGSADASLTPEVLAFFSRINVLADLTAEGENSDPATIVRPHDRYRSGFLIGEGAGVLMLERAETAAARGVTPIAEWLGFACGSDAVGLTRLDPEASGLATIIGQAIERSGCSPEDIDLINLHGTATRANDLAEAIAMRSVFGSRLPPAESYKGQLGHLLGAAGSVETAIALKSLSEQKSPGTANLTEVDPACELNHRRRPGPLNNTKTLLKVSLGFGGHLAAAVLRLG